MIMPANYSAIAENELSYVNGGFVDPIKDIKILETNIATAIGNLYVRPVMDAFIGVWFDEDGTDSVFKLFGDAVGDLFTHGAGEKDQGTGLGRAFKVVRNTIGVLGGIWVLGTNSVYKAPEWKGGTFSFAGDKGIVK